MRIAHLPKCAFKFESIFQHMGIDEITVRTNRLYFRHNRGEFVGGQCLVNEAPELECCITRGGPGNARFSGQALQVGDVRRRGRKTDANRQ